jgi:hypothetical protein
MAGTSTSGRQRREAESVVKVIYSVISSLDGYVADPSGDFLAEPDASVIPSSTI